jgi:hypothetical protein
MKKVLALILLTGLAGCGKETNPKVLELHYGNQTLKVKYFELYHDTYRGGNHIALRKEILKEISTVKLDSMTLLLGKDKYLLKPYYVMYSNYDVDSDFMFGVLDRVSNKLAIREANKVPTISYISQNKDAGLTHKYAVLFSSE